jgi:hypothetical protein
VEHGTGVRNQRSENRDQRSENREQRIEKPDRGISQFSKCENWDIRFRVSAVSAMGYWQHVSR